MAVFAFASPVQSASSSTVARPDGLAVPALTRDNSGHGYHLVTADGGVFSLGWFRNQGSASDSLQRDEVTGTALHRGSDGYWLASREGGVFAFGDAGYHGSLHEAGVKTKGVVGIAATPTGRGYWLASRDGGVFAFGDAPYHGSLSASGPIIGIAATPTGDGYWLASRDGGVFSFGDAPYHGSLHEAGVATTSVVAVAATPTGDAYWLASRDGGVFSFGDAGYHGSLRDAGGAAGPVAAMAASPTGRGYWLFGPDGGVFAFGDTGYHGSMGGRPLNAPVVAAAAGRGRFEQAPLPKVESPPPPAPPSASPPPPPPPPPPPSQTLPPGPSDRAAGSATSGGRMGYDISYPQCDRSYPASPYAFGIVGVTRGRAFRHNPCLADQWSWAKSSGAAGVYINVNFPGPANELALGATGPQPDCNGALPCIAYNFGFNGAQDALNYATAQGVAVPFVWLDIETMNYWTDDRPLNAVVVRGAIDAVRQAGKEVGIYSTPYQWKTIAGDFAPGVPVWIAGAPNLDAAPGWCHRSFAGHAVVMVQTLPVVFDENYTCPGHGTMGRFFAT